jgi:hypothetical protein
MLFRMLHIVVFPFFWLLNWNDCNKYQTRNFFLILLYWRLFFATQSSIFLNVSYFISQKLTMYFCITASSNFPPKRKLPSFYGFFSLCSLWNIFECFFFRSLHTVDLRYISALQIATEKIPETVKCNKKYSFYLHGITIHT